jgi:sterol desaturase/sphingolipid hydroxylase (fatty acid hydroxylase superfamily)
MILELTALALLTCSSRIHEGWGFLCDTYSDFSMTVWGLFCSLVVGYFLGCVPYLLLDFLKIPFFEKYKVQTTRYPSKANLEKCCLNLFVLFFFVMLPMIAFSYPLFKSIGVSREAPLPSAFTVIVQVLFFFLVEDFGNYWLHRWLHTSWAYKNIHFVHHEYSAPFALAATYAHPLEVVILGIPTFAGPVVVGPHLFTLWVWLMMRQYEAVDIHSGYEFPWNLNCFLSFYGGTEHHDYHHYLYSGNYASIFTWCDAIYGTNLSYKMRKYSRDC